MAASFETSEEEGLSTIETPSRKGTSRISDPSTPTTALHKLSLKPTKSTSKFRPSTAAPRSIQKRRGIISFDNGTSHKSSRNITQSLRKRKVPYDSFSDEDAVQSPSKVARHASSTRLVSGRKSTIRRASSRRSSSPDPLVFERRTALSDSDYEDSPESTIEDEMVEEPIPVEVQNSTKNYVTENIFRLARGSFITGLTSLGPEPAQEEFSASRSKSIGRSLLQNFNKAAFEIKMGSKLPENEDYFKSVRIDGEKYKPGDFVLIELGVDDNKSRQKQSKSLESVNDIANKFWFAQVVSISLAHTSTMFHVRWFEHASRTILGECSSPQELLLTEECDDIDAATVVAKAKIIFLPTGTLEPIQGSQPDVFFYRYLSLPNEAAICDATNHLNSPDHFEMAACISCQRREWQEASETPVLGGAQDLTFMGQTYHLDEFVYLEPDTSPDSEVYVLGQIKELLPPNPTDKVGEARIRVRIILRQSPPSYQSEEEPGFYDDRLLFYGEDELLWPADRLRNKFFVINSARLDDEAINAWVRDPDHFHMGQHVSNCHICYRGHKLFLKSLAAVSKERPLRALDLFAGSGGLALGLDPTGHINTEWSVERDLSAAKTLQIENVRGMVTYGLHNSDGESIKHGMLKIILRCLTSIGYQVRFGILNAGSFGTPQSRDRLIILAARRDCPLPKMPTPTHAFVSRAFCPKLTDGFQFPQTTNLSAGLPPITVSMAINDLPVFNWKNPYDPLSKGEGHLNFRGLHKALPYHYAEPINRYQQYIRNGSQQVRQHFTLKYTDITIKRTCLIPFDKDANWESLPDGDPELKPDKWFDGRPWRKYLYQRIWGDGSFPTSMTQVQPASRHGRVLHPTQKRVITLREYARSQGFPDNYEFHTTSNTDMFFKQVGNAVPIPLGRALGRELGKVLLQETKPRETWT
ncbi:hypothetical protein FRB97_006545 [Tulasnella sp. 331]|nr:hypothetical protein FRB97_006545 [Tulasnella sp. 331]